MNHKLFRANQLISYAIIGVASNIAGYAAYVLLTFFLIEPKFAMTLVYLIGATVGYFSNRRWTFMHKGRGLQALIKYSLAHLFGYAFNFFLLYVFVDRMSYPHQVVQLVAIFVVASMLFIISRNYVFSDSLSRFAPPVNPK